MSGRNRLLFYLICLSGAVFFGVMILVSGKPGVAAAFAAKWIIFGWLFGRRRPEVLEGKDT